MDKRTTEREAVSELRDGMTIGIGGWGSRRKPMSIVREILRSSVRDLTVVTYGGPDVGLLCKAGKIKRLVYGFVSLDSIPLEPHFRQARQAGSIEAATFLAIRRVRLAAGLRAVVRAAVRAVALAMALASPGGPGDPEPALSFTIPKI